MFFLLKNSELRSVGLSGVVSPSVDDAFSIMSWHESCRLSKRFVLSFLESCLSWRIFSKISVWELML